MMVVEIEDDTTIDSLYDERVAVRKTAFRNAEVHPTRINLPLDHSAESITSMGAPSWLVGSVYYLVPAIFDVYYWDHHMGWNGLVVHRARKSFDYPDDCLRMLVHIEFLDSGVVQYKSQLLGRRALEEWKRAEGSADRLDVGKIKQVLGGRRKGRWLEFSKGGDVEPDAAVIQSSIMTTFPMGTYHGTESRTVLHQIGSKKIQTVEPLSLRPKQLVSYCDLNGRFVGVPCTSPLVDPRTKEMINVLIEYGKAGKFARYHVVSIGGTEDIYESGVIASFLAMPTRLDSFAITNDYVIVVIHPLYYERRIPDFGANIVAGIEEYLEFQSEKDTLFYVVSRRPKQLVAVYRSERAFVASMVNAFEGDNVILVDVVASEIPEKAVKVGELRDINFDDYLTATNCPRRYCLFRLSEEMARFDGAAGQLSSFPLASYHLLTEYELGSPFVTPSSVGSPYRYIYALSVNRDNRGRPGYLPNAIVKCDLASPVKSMQWHKSGHYPSPPVFVPKSELAYQPPWQRGSTDDDGVLITLTLDVFANRSYLMVLDAKDLRELARYVLPKAMPIATALPAWSPSRMAGPLLESSGMTEKAATALLPRD